MNAVIALMARLDHHHVVDLVTHRQPILEGLHIFKSVRRCPKVC
jgi:hypothetical protein